jgi:hypothetical protein
MTALTQWQNFYEIVGSSAGALIGLQFVVLALISNLPNLRREADASATFATPTIVHFGAVLFLAGAMTMPWHAIAPIEIVWAAGGATGVLYALLTTRRLSRQSAYRPQLEDWIFHSLLPFVAYAALIAAAWCAYAQRQGAFFCVAAAALLLLLIGIHNAWDTVTYHVFSKR